MYFTVTAPAPVNQEVAITALLFPHNYERGFRDSGLPGPNPEDTQRKKWV